MKQAFFNGYVRFHPEEATTLGLADGADRLRDHSPAALDEERRWFEAMAAQLEAAEDDDLDHLCMRRLVQYHLHAWPRLYNTIDWSLYPYNMIQVQRIHATTDEERRAIQSRLADVPRFLKQQEAIVTVAPDRTLRDFLVDVMMPRAIAAIGDEAAAAAYEEHRAWMASLDVTESGSVGEEELCWRLSNMLGIDDTPADLVAGARQDLAEIQELMIATAAKVAPARRITTLAHARSLALEMQEEKLASSVDPIAYFREHTNRARSLVTEKRLFDVPDDYVIGIEPLPAGFDEFGAGTNWPAPLLAKDKLGHFVVNTDPSAHLTAWAAEFSVHEGLPGHHLQSFIWQRQFHDDPAPVRFLVVHDQVAIPRNYWAPMLNIEGWAVYTEEVMRQAGYFTPAEEMFVLMAHSARAARVVCDISLHCGTMQRDEAKAFLMSDVCLTDKHAELEVRRYLQVPLQASTYHLGRCAIEELAKNADDLAAFHNWFLSFGPVDPRALAPRATEA